MSDKLWYKKTLRIVQTVLREPDIVNYNAKEVIKYLKKVKANVIVVNGGGVVDFFDNRMEMSNPNPFMTNENMLSDLVKEARENEIKVMLRVDFRGVERARYNLNPHWFAVNADGSPKLNAQGLYTPCYNSIYVNKHAVEFIKYLIEKFNIDGIWENAVGFGVGPCYCKTCRELYMKEIGEEIPVGEDYLSPVFRKYREWKATCADRHIKLLRDTVKGYGEEKAYCAEIFGIFNADWAKYTGIDLYNAKRYFDFLVSPTFLTGGSLDKPYDNLWYAASSVRFMKSLDKERQAVVLYGNNGTKWRYIKDPEVETKVWLWEAASVGGGFWNCMFNGQHPGATFDNRNAYIESDAYHYIADNEDIIKTQVPVGDVGIYFSKQSRDIFGSDDEHHDEYGVCIKGVEKVLMANHIQYNFIPDEDFSLDKIKGYKLLILPNAACMPDEHIKIIETYVQTGGGLIASYESSLYDEDGVKRSDFGLKKLFGCSYTGIAIDTSVDCYQMLNGHHFIIDEINNTSLVMNGGKTLLCTSLDNKKYKTVLTYVPIIPNQPPEKAWIKEMKTEFPTLIAGEYGKGRVVYFSNQIDKLCYINGHEDFENIFYKAIEWVKREPLSIDTNAPDSIHIALTRDNYDKCNFVLSMVNLTSSPTRPIKHLLPVYNFTVNVKLEGSSLREYKILKQDGDIRVKNVNSDTNEAVVSIEVERLDEFASIFLKMYN